MTILKNSQNDSTEIVRSNRKHKDILFRMIFEKKEDLLDLYNAVNASDYDDPEELTITTLEDALYMGYKNDISFLLGEILCLYEHQSTQNPNMPLRGLIYFSRNYQSYIELHHLDIYSSVLQKIPFPQYIVFYNGTAEIPERQILRLSDAFPKYDGKTPCLSCEATLLNINYGKNKQLMERCQKLKEYTIFIAAIRSGLVKGLSPEDALTQAMNLCINEHILENFLIKHRAEVKNVVLSTFDQENHDRILKEYAEKVGIEQGEKKAIISLVMKKLSKQIPLDEISDILEESPETIHPIADAIQNHPEADIDEIYALVYGES